MQGLEWGLGAIDGGSAARDRPGEVVDVGVRTQVAWGGLTWQQRTRCYEGCEPGGAVRERALPTEGQVRERGSDDHGERTSVANTLVTDWGGADGTPPEPKGAYQQGGCCSGPPRRT